jgi:hypothetical protein
MDFDWTSGNPNLTAPAHAGGLGLTPAQIATVKVWQKVNSYTFNFHTGSHGDACVYIKPDGWKGKNMPCIWIAGTKDGQMRSTDRLSSKVKSDVKKLIDNNKDLFVAMWTAFNA